MRSVRIIFFLLLASTATFGQTAHIDSNRVAYKGTVKVGDTEKQELLERARNALVRNVNGSRESKVSDTSERGMISRQGSIKLASPHRYIKSVEFVLELSVKDEKYEYRIDSVYVKEIERGGKTKKMPSEKLLKDMEVSGLVSAEAEKQLNEIDMHFQKLLAQVRADMTGKSAKGSQ